MALQTAAQFGRLTPDVGRSIQSGLASRQAIQEEQNRERLRQQAESQLATRQRALGVTPEMTPQETPEQAQRRMLAEDPARAKQILDRIGIETQQQREEAAVFATNALAAPPEDRARLIAERVRDVTARGGDATQTMALLDLDPDQQERGLAGLKVAALTEMQRQQVRAKGARAEGPSQVQSSTILPGGVVQIVRKDGTVEVVEQGAENADIIRRAEERGVDLQQQRAQSRGLGKDAAEQAGQVATQVGKLRSNNRKLNKVIELVGDGAETGPLAAKLPSFRAETLRLKQIQSELGLDVIGSVTFGALSEGELNLAMETALPEKLQGPELVDWAREKINAQEKLANYFEDQAFFLSTPGNTQADWLQSQRAIKERQAQPAAQAPQAAVPAQPAQAPVTQTINTQAEYDALPSGAQYIDPDDGKLYRKP